MPRTKPFKDAQGNYIIDDGNLVQMHSETGVFSESINGALGSINASRDWNKNHELARKMFLHTSVYKKFAQDDALILLGKTGDGKTAILKCAENDIKYPDCRYNVWNKYKTVVSINCDEALKELSRDPELNEASPVAMSAIAKDVLMKLIYVAIMKGVYSQYKEDRAADLAKIKGYLNSLNLLEVDAGENFASILRTSLKNNQSSSGNGMVNTAKDGLLTFLEFRNAFNTSEYSIALTELIRFASNERILVLIDSFDEYDISNPELIMIVKSLIDVVFSFHNISNGIFVKIALPSEIYSSLLIRLPAKLTQNAVVISWSFKELIVMIALRIHVAYNNEKEHFTEEKKLLGFDFCDRFEASDFYHDENPQAYDNARCLLSNFFPEKHKIGTNFSFDALAYCMRHTLNKPRDVVHLFNKLVQKLLDEKNVRYFVDNTGTLSSFVHSTQEYMIMSSLSMYKDSYKGIYDIIIEMLSSVTFLMQGKDIKNHLAEKVKQLESAGPYGLRGLTAYEHADYYDKLWPLDEKDIAKILLESGLLGEVQGINEPSDSYGCIIIADFEYKFQIMRPQLSNNRQYVFNPLCYETYGIWADSNTLVYPKRIFDDEFAVAIKSG